MKKPSPASAIFGLLTIGLIAILALVIISKQDPLTSSAPGQTSMGPIGAPYVLRDQDGNEFNSEKLADTYQLVYFGFTACPDICPVELQKMAQALLEAGDKAKQIQPVLITIDPARDTPDVLKKYLSNYDANFIGLTGTEAEIDAVIKSYKVYAAKVSDPKYDEYMMDHSSFIYFLGPHFELIDLFSKDDSAAAMAEQLKAKLP
jgi:protein SCO1/2